MVNEINSTFPDVVISRMSSPKQEQFIYENRDKINAKMLIALKNKFNPEESFRSSKFHSLGEKIHKTVFKHKVSRYENSQDGKE